MKDNLDDALHIDYPTALHREAERLVGASRTEDHKEAVRAFVEKRKPVFTGVVTEHDYAPKDVTGLRRRMSEALRCRWHDRHQATFPLATPLSSHVSPTRAARKT